MFRSGHDCTSASSEKRPLYFRQTDISIPGNESKCHVCSIPLLLAAPKVFHEKNWRFSMFWNTFINPSLNSCSQPGTPCNSSSCNSPSSFSLGFSISVGSCHEFPRSIFSNSSRSAIRRSPFQIPPAINAYPEKIPAKLVKS